MAVSNQERRYLVSPDVRVRKTQGEALLLDLRSGDCFGLNAMGLAVLRELEVHGNFEQLIMHLLQEFEIDRETLEVDVRQLIQRLTERGLLLSEVSSPG